MGAVSARGPEDGRTAERDYYRRVAPRLLPFLFGRPVWPEPGTTMSGRAHPVERVDDLLRLVEEGARGFSIPPVDERGEVWTVLRLTTPSGCPFEVVRLTTLKLALVLEDTGLEPWFCYDGEGGLMLLWSLGVPDEDGPAAGIETFHDRVLTSLQDRLETRLAGTPERDRIGRWLGYEGPVTRLEEPVPGMTDGGGAAGERRSVGPQTGDEDEEWRVGLHLVPVVPGGRLRAPWSLHEASVKALRPLSRQDLYRFDPERDALPAAVAGMRRDPPVPYHPPRYVERVLLENREDPASPEAT